MTSGVNGSKFSSAGNTQNTGRGPDLVNRQEQSTNQISRKILKHGNELIENAKNAENKEILVLLGDTACGKSTIVNDLLGFKMKRWKRENRYVIDVEGDPPRDVKGDPLKPASIGHNSKSETHFANTYPFANEVVQAIVDCSGFCDNRADVMSSVGALSIELTLDAASSVRLAICCPYVDIMHIRGIHLQAVLHAVYEHFLGEPECKTEVLFFITRRPPCDGDSGDILDNETAKKNVIDLLKQLSKEEEINIFMRKAADFILRNDAHYLIVYDPMDKNSRGRCLELMSEIDPITDITRFKTPFSAKVVSVLKDELDPVAKLGIQLYKKYFKTLEKIKKLVSDLYSLVDLTDEKEKHEKTKTERDELKKKFLEAKKQNINNEYQVKIEGLEKELIDLDQREIERCGRAITDTKAQLRQMQTDKEGLWPFHSDVVIARRKQIPKYRRTTQCQGKKTVNTPNGYTITETASIIYPNGYPIVSITTDPDHGWSYTNGGIGHKTCTANFNITYETATYTRLEVLGRKVSVTFNVKNSDVKEYNDEIKSLESELKGLEKDYRIAQLERNMATFLAKQKQDDSEKLKAERDSKIEKISEGAKKHEQETSKTAKSNIEGCKLEGMQDDDLPELHNNKNLSELKDEINKIYKKVIKCFEKKVEHESKINDPASDLALVPEFLKLCKRGIETSNITEFMGLYQKYKGNYSVKFRRPDASTNTDQAKEKKGVSSADAKTVLKDHLKKCGLKEHNVPGDGSCFYHAFLESFKCLPEDMRREFPSLNNNNELSVMEKVEYLRRLIVLKLKEMGKDFAHVELHNGWMHGQGEGDLLAGILKIPMRLITVSVYTDGTAGVYDELVFSDPGKPNQAWETLTEKEKPQDYVVIVHNGINHFNYALPESKSKK